MRFDIHSELDTGMKHQMRYVERKEKEKLGVRSVGYQAAIPFPELHFDLVMKIVVETAFISLSSFEVSSH